MWNLLTDILARARSCRIGIAYALLALGACCFAAQPLVRQALPLAHDVGFHLFQADQFASSLHSGVILPRWVADANMGYGSPNFVFYAPLSYYLTAALNLLSGSVQAAMIVTILLAFFISGIAMFHAAGRLCGREGALVAGILYQVLPYHLLDLYARCTLAELFAFTWFPLVFLFAHGVFSSDRKHLHAAGLSVTYAALILTHLVSGYIFTPVLLAFFVFEYLSHKKVRDATLAMTAMAGGLGLASFYLVPVVFERKFVHIDFIVRCFVGNFRDNFLFWLGHAPQGLHNFGAMLHLATILDLVVFISLVAVLRGGAKEKEEGEHTFFTLLFLVALFMTTPLSGPLWVALPGLATLQFPWRFLSLMEVSLCFLAGKVVSGGAGCAGSGTRDKAVVYSLLTVLLVGGIIVAKSGSTIAAGYRGYPVAREYTPATVTELDALLTKKTIKVETVAGTASSQVREWLPERRVLAANASTRAVVRVATSYYPGWIADIDGVAVPVGVETGSGAILIGVAPGNHLVTLRFVDTPLRAAAKYISAAFFTMLLGYLAFTVGQMITEKQNIAVERKMS
ncbi:6-pyruvoyl-tetrahydropterin synthase-related protein [Geomonas agri]|uniref:6-pyruvoyl-tetrahydropterin synthase-related protein n=1 Tax=Geomonas agri TaxID=2873702 RepID=UPI001CD45058|nr:6-pyruvoyl-tetrahydropterin synthase-related protein [Geomonas agri]